MGKKTKDYSEYQKHYSTTSFWDKIANFAQAAGLKVIYAALLLHKVLNSPNVSAYHKGLIWGALGYFILPIDLIPDMIPVVGFSDDLTALLACLAAVASNVTENMKQDAKAQLRQWFGNFNSNKIDNMV